MSETEPLSLTDLRDQRPDIAQTLLHTALDGTRFPPSHALDVLVENGYADDQGVLFPEKREAIIADPTQLY